MTAVSINLNKARKAKARAEAAATAIENRVKFGRTKGQKKADAQSAAKSARDFDDHKRER